ncbi:MAG: phosphopantetheine-binding protein, partial [Pyrinomonadaceae bacterium]
IWCEVLEVEVVGVHDNFFELGGHSLLAMLMISQVREELNVELGLRDIFTAPTVGELAVIIVQHIADQSEDGNINQMLKELDQLTDTETKILLDRNASKV